LKFNQDKITKLTSEILKAVQRLEELKNLSKEEFLSDHHKIGSAKYHLLIAVEGAVDLCNHIIAKNAFRTPENYADTFKVMVIRHNLRKSKRSQVLQTSRICTRRR